MQARCDLDADGDGILDADDDCPYLMDPRQDGACHAAAPRSPALAAPASVAAKPTLPFGGAALFLAAFLAVAALAVAAWRSRFAS